MSCRKGFRAFDTSGGWPIGNVKSCFSSAAFWPKRRNRRPSAPDQQVPQKCPKCQGQCALLNALPPDRFAIRRRSQSRSPWILLRKASNTARCMLLWACIAEVCFHLKQRSFFHPWEEAKLNDAPF